MPTRVLLEGPAIEPLLAQVREEYGPGIRIISADKVRNGGFGGFFAKQHYELAVEVPDAADKPSSPAVPGARSATPGATANTLEQLLEQVEARDQDVTPAAAPAADRLVADRQQGKQAGKEDLDEWFRPESGNEFAELLADLDPGKSTGTATSGSVSGAGSGAMSGSGREATVRPFLPARAIGAPVNGGGAKSAAGGVPSLADVMGGLGMTTSDPELDEPAPAGSAAAAYGLNAERAAKSPVRRPTPPRPAAPSFTPAPVPAVVPAPMPEPVSAELVLPEPIDLARQSVIHNLTSVGMPAEMAGRVSTADTYAGVLMAIAERPPAPRVPDGPGDVLLVAGDLNEAVPAGRQLLTDLGLDESHLLLAAPSAAGTGIHSSRVLHTPEVAATRAARLHKADGPAVVVLAAPPNATDPEWVRNIREALDATALWAVVDATRKATDTARQLEALGDVEALLVRNVERTADPATVLGLEQPIYSLDGKPANPHYWAALLCARISADVIPAIAAPPRRPTRER